MRGGSIAAVRWAMLVVVAVALLLGECEAREISKTAASNEAPTLASWSACQSTVCHRVSQEAEGLARVKLLRGYVSETVRLLSSLMTSMDSELVEIAKEMKGFVGHRCSQAHAMLDQVAAPMLPTDNLLSAGIMEESTAQKMEEQSPDGGEDLSGGIIGGTQDEERESDYNSNTQWASTSTTTDQRYSTSGTGRQLDDGTSTFSDRRGEEEDNQHSWGHDYDSTREDTGSSSWSGSQHSERWDGQGNSHGTSKYPGRYDGDRNSNANRGINGHGSIPGQHSVNDFNSLGNRHDSNNRYDGQHASSNKRPPPVPTHGSSTNWRPIVTGPNCKGLPGSPYTVPGIDSWCVLNCSKGYCPATHCICS